MYVFVDRFQDVVEFKKEVLKDRTDPLNTFGGNVEVAILIIFIL